jgi:N-acetylated-alpha-linked acidic dipeptidase
LLGSTEWGEAHADELKQHAAVYINTDANDRGYLQVGGSHSPENFVNEVAPEIADPETKMNVWKREKLASIAQAKGKDREELRSRPDMRIEALGSGSDFTVFLQHLGIATLNLGYGGEGEGGQYHSIYDDFYWYTHYSDGDFIYGRALAQTVGTMVLRLADADMIPFQFSDLAETVHKYVTELKGLETDKRDEARERNRELEEGVYDALRDPQKTLVAPPREEIPPHLNFAPLDQAADELTEAAEAFDKAFNAAAGNASPELNNDLLRAERVLTDDQGLPNRPWFKHVLYAPGFYTGYGVKTMPGVREAIEQKRWAEADQEIKRTATALEHEVDLLKKATERLHSKSADAGR